VVDEFVGRVAADNRINGFFKQTASDPKRLAIASHDPSDNMPVKMDITPLTEGTGSLFYPYTTTFLEVFVEREPMPLGDVSELFTFPERM